MTTKSHDTQFTSLGIESEDSSSSGDAAMIVLSVIFTVGSIAMGYLVFRTWKNRQSYSVSSILPEDPKVSTGLRIDPTVLEIGAVLGHGSKGRVMKAMFRGSAVCVKELSVNSAPQKLEKELTELLQVRHPSLVLCMGLSVPAENKVWVVSEYMERGPLYRVLHDDTAVTLDWKQRIGMATSVAQAMNYLHQVRPGKDPVLHRRLNSLNVLITQNFVAKVSDYGLHGLFKSARDTDVTTKPFWTAPEVLKSGKYSTASDVYSFGILLWEIVTRQRPFYHCKQMNTVQLIRAILNGERPTLLRTAPGPLQQLLQDCLQGDPSKRPKFDMVLDSLQLLENYNFNSDELMQIEIESGLEKTNKGKLSSFAEIRGNNIDKSWMVKPSEFTIEAELGHGSFGKVYTGTFRGKKVAIKKFSSNNFDHQRLNEFVRELQIMCSLHHPNTVLFMGACLEEDNICIIMEFCNRGTLHHVLHDKSQHIDYKRIIQILTGIAQGMNYLHLSRPPILHRDLKSLNILIDEDWNAKVSDFGLTRFKSDDLNPEETHAGTPFWMAPEVLESQTCTEAADVYSYGVIIQEMFTRDNPYPGMNPHQVALEVITSDIRPEIPAFVPPRVQRLMRACWDRSAANRPTFSQVLEELKIIQSEGVPRIELSLGNARLYQKCHTVHAFRSKDQVTVFKSWGTGESKCGDWIIVGPGDDVYTCDAVIFSKTYEAVPGKKHCYRKTGRVLALKMPTAFLVETLEGTEHGLTGDYLAQNPIDGEQWPIAEQTFESMYELSIDQTMPVRQEVVVGAGRDLPPVAESEDTLSSATGYLSANSHPPAVMYNPASNANSFQVLGQAMTNHSLPPSHSNVSSSSSFSTYNNNSSIPHSTATTAPPVSSYYGNQSAYAAPGGRGGNVVSKAQLSPPFPSNNAKSASPSSAASTSAVEMENSEFGDSKLAPRPPSGPRPTSSGRLQVSRSGVAVSVSKESSADYSKGLKEGGIHNKSDVHDQGKSAEVANQFSEQC